MPDFRLIRHAAPMPAQQGADLDPETRQCRPGRVCSHYQQLVAPSAREVGCARLVCPALDQVWICQYRLG